MSTVKPLALTEADSGGESKYGDMRDYRGPSLMQPHRAQQAIRDAHAKKIPRLIGLYVGLASKENVRWFAPMGYDWFWLDMEHAGMDIETMTTMAMETIHMSEGRTMPFVRVPSHDHHFAVAALNSGASVIFPRVDTVAEAKHVAAGTKFGRRNNGMRSAPPWHYMRGVTDTPHDPSKLFHENLNQQAAVLIQVESAVGVRNLDQILAEVPEIDAVWFGRLDAQVDAGLKPFQCWEEPEWLELEKIFAETMKKHDKPTANFAFASGEELKGAAENMTMVIINADVEKLAELKQELVAARGTLKPTGN